MIAWYITTYNLTTNPTMRVCAMDAYTSTIIADGGKWEEIEVGANRAIVKVKASSATISVLDGAFTRIPVSLLSDSLSSLTSAQKTAISNQLAAMGYTTQEVIAALGTDIGSNTLRQLLQFMSSRRVPPRMVNGSIVFDLPPVACTNSIDGVDGRVQ